MVSLDHMIKISSPRRSSRVVERYKMNYCTTKKILVWAILRNGPCQVEFTSILLFRRLLQESTCMGNSLGAPAVAGMGAMVCVDSRVPTRGC